MGALIWLGICVAGYFWHCEQVCKAQIKRGEQENPGPVTILWLCILFAPAFAHGCNGGGRYSGVYDNGNVRQGGGWDD